MRVLWLCFLIMTLAACQPQPLAPSMNGMQAKSVAPSAALGIRVQWPHQDPGFTTQALPQSTHTVQIEINDRTTKQLLYATTLTKDDVVNGEVTRQIRISMGGQQERPVTIIVNARNNLAAIVATGKTDVTLRAGEINAAKVVVTVTPGNVSVIGGGGGGGGGGGPVTPTPTPTPPPTTYTITPDASVIYTLPGATLTQNFRVWNGVAPYTWSQPTLPANSGLTFTSAGADATISSGNVTLTPGEYSFTLEVTDANNDVTTRSYRLVVRNLQIFPSSVKQPVNGQTYVQAIQALYGVGGDNYTWKCSNCSSLASAGLSLITVNNDANQTDGPALDLNNPEGTVTGNTIRLKGTYTGTVGFTFTLQVTNGTSIASQTYVVGCMAGSLVSLQPVVDSVIPASGENDSAQVITLSGSNFRTDSVVVLDSYALQTNAANAASGSLQAVVPAGVQPGTYNVLVFNPDGTYGRIEGGLANGYTVTDTNNSFVSAKPRIDNIGMVITSNQVLALVANGQPIPNVQSSIAYDFFDFATLVVDGANFTQDSAVFISDLLLPAQFIDSTRIIVIVPVKSLFPDFPTLVSQNPLLTDKYLYYNRLVIINSKLEVSDPDRGRLPIFGSEASPIDLGSGFGQVAYVYPQKGFDDQTAQVTIKGCGLERLHSFRIGAGKSLSAQVEAPSTARSLIPAGMLFPIDQPYSIELLRAEGTGGYVPVVPGLSGAYRVLSKGAAITGCSPTTVPLNTVKGINLIGRGFVEGASASFIPYDSFGNLIGAPITAILTTVTSPLNAVAFAPAGLPEGDYGVQLSFPGTGLNTIAAPGTCFRIQAQASSNPVISSVGIQELDATPACGSTSLSVTNAEDPVRVMRVCGSGFREGAIVHIGSYQVTTGDGSATEIAFTTGEFRDLAPGTYTLRVVNPDGATATLGTPVTITDGGGQPAVPPVLSEVFILQGGEGCPTSLIDNRCSAISETRPYKSLFLPNGSETREVGFVFNNTDPGSYLQLVPEDNSLEPMAFDPNHPILSSLDLTYLGSSGTAYAKLPYSRALPGGRAYRVRLVNSDGQLATSTQRVFFADSPAPAIATPTQISNDSTSYFGCLAPVCPASVSNLLNASVTINGVVPANDSSNFADDFAANASTESPTVYLEKTDNPNIRVTLNSVIVDGGYRITARLSPFTAPGTYRVVVRNPDGQSTDDNQNDYEALVTITDSPNFWTYGQNMVMPTTLEGFPSGPGGHGRLGSTMVVDPETQKLFIFGGTSGQGIASVLPKTLITFAESEGWRAISGANIPTELSARFGHTAVWIEGDPSTAADDRMLIYGGYGQPDGGGNASVVSDLIWLYNPNLTGAGAWQAVTVPGNITMPRLSYAQSFWRTDSGQESLYLFGGVDQNGNLAYDCIAGTVADHCNNTPANRKLPVYRIVLNAGKTEVASATLVTTQAGGLDVPLPRAFFSLAAHPRAQERTSTWQRVYLSGGADSAGAAGSSNFRNDLWLLNLSSGNWFEHLDVTNLNAPAKPHARRFGSMVARMKPGTSTNEVELYIYGGEIPNGEFAGQGGPQGSLAKITVQGFGASTSVADYIATDVTSVAVRQLHSAVWANDRMYVFGGSGQEGILTWEGIIQSVTHPATQLWRFIPVN